VMASVGPPNIPSARTLRSVGLRYLMSDMRGVEGPFKGASTANGPSLSQRAHLRLLSAWAMNPDSQPGEAG